VRGFGRPGDFNTRILVLIDGMRTNDNIYDMAAVGGDFLVDVDLIERVEVVRGPSASIYGNSAFFAVINVITKRGRDVGAEGSAAAASYGTFRGRTSYGHRFQDGLEVLASVSGLDSDGQSLYFPEFDAPETNDGIADGRDGEQWATGFGKVAKGPMTFVAAHVLRDKSYPTGAYGSRFNDPRSATWDERSLVALSFDGKLGERLDGFARLHYDRYRYRGNYPFGAGPDEDYVDHALADGWGLDAGTSTRLGRHRLTFGGELQDKVRQDQVAEEGWPLATTLEVRDRSRSFGVFLQDEVSLTSALVAHLGLRHDWGRLSEGRTSPRLGLIWTPRDSTSVKLLYGEAFRAPNEYELHYFATPESGLAPETIRTLEGVLEQFVGPNVRFTASVFDNRIDGLISFAAIAGGTADYAFRNVERIDSAGVEFGAEAKLRGGTRGRVSYSYQATREHGSSVPLSNSPRHLTKLLLSQPLAAARLTAGLDLQHVSARRTPSGGHVDGFVTANLTLRAPRLVGALDVTASVYNLFDARYSDPGSEEHVQDAIAQNGRNAQLRLTWRF
jgi:iron complex outermembrane receptor protein